MERYLFQQLKKDLGKKMVLLGGPRQVGKTTLGRSLFSAGETLYLNFDVSSGRSRILRQEFGPQPFWIFDELHKYKKWKNYLKGVYDEHHNKHRILVTGSARLDFFRKAGDSLQGRYHFLRLNPLSAREIGAENQKQLQDLFLLGGFPEPFLGADKVEADRWSREYQSRLIHDEIRDVERVSDLASMELLSYRLPECVGSPLSVNALREDLQLNHKTVQRWLDILERFYAIFRLSPFGSPKVKAVKKERKHYQIDWNLIEAEGYRFENFVAVHLLKHVQFIEDTQGRSIELRYYRDIEGREVDFIVVEKGKPVLAVEAKWGDDAISSSLGYFKNKFPGTECWQIHFKGKKDYVSKEGIRVAPAIDLFKTLAC